MPTKALKVSTVKRKKAAAVNKVGKEPASPSLYVITQSGRSRKILVSPPNAFNHQNADEPWRRMNAKLSDPDIRSSIKNSATNAAKDRTTALQFLRELGLATPTGKLSRRFGG